MRLAASFTIIMFLLGILTNSCAVFDVAYSKKPEKVAKKFLDCLYSGDYEKARNYGTAHTRQIIDLMDQLVAISGEKTLPVNSKVQMLDSEVRGDSALCNYFVNDVKSELLLLKTDGKWLVEMKKEASGKSGGKDFLKIQK